MQETKLLRKIIHIDMDCFYAAVELKHRPELKGRPVAIGGPVESRSVLCTSNYEARKYGVRAAMSSRRAVQLCPDLILIPPHFELYKEESQKVREIFARFTSKIEPLSLDEAYLDVTESSAFQGSATLMAEEIRRLIFSERNLTASAGIAPNKFLAKIASDWKKPNGQFVIRPQDVPEFIKALPIEKIFGVGKVTAKAMHQAGYKTCADLQAKSLTELKLQFGSRAEDLYWFSRGVDHRPVESEWIRKSLSVEETFEKDLKSFEECRRRLVSLYDDFLERLEKGAYQNMIRGFVVKVKFYDFQQTTHESRGRHIPQLSDFQALLEKAWQRRGEPVRLIGIGVRLSPEDGHRDRTRQSISMEDTSSGQLSFLDLDT